MPARRAQSAALLLRALHERAPLELPNAWDAASAAVIEAAGAAAIATTSAGISWAHGMAANGTLPINVMIAPGAPDIAALARAGARRISAGSAIAQAAYALAAQAAAEMLQAGTYESMRSTLDYGQLNDMLDLGKQ
jgi:2-methylisocitrate lyase-like PEP mutase family enzyme